MTATTGVRSERAAAPDADAAPAPGLRPSEWATIAYAGALLVLVVPSLSADHWTPKVAVALVALVPGLVVLVRAALAHDRAAVAGVAVVVVAAVSTIWSPRPLLALLGPYNAGDGLLFVAVVVGAWSLGRRLSPAGARMLGSVVLAAATLNAVFAWLQMSSAFHSDLFARVQGRSPALLGNPVHATAFLVGAFALAVERCREPGATRDGRVVALGACALFASGVQLTGGRTGLVLLAIVVLLALVRSGWRVAGLVVVLGVVGVALASAAYPSGTGAAARLAGSNDASVLGRVHRWEMAIPAVADRPLLGIGPGLYRRATSPHDTAAAARAFGADALNQDAHNLFVEYAVTVGLVGLVALLVWLVLAASGARGELVWFVAFGGVSLLLQPQFIGLTPVLALALGAAAPMGEPPASARVRRIARGVAVVGAVAGAVVAVLLVRGDAEYRRAVVDGCPATAHRAADLLPMWPEPLLLAASLETADRGCSPGGMRPVAIRDVRAAIRRDTSSPTAWTTLGDLELDGGDVPAARRAYRRALRWNPQSTVALAGLAGIARDDGRTAEAARLCRRFRTVLPQGVCVPPRH